MTEFTSPHQEQDARDGIIKIDGLNVKTPVPRDHLVAIPEPDEMIIPRPITNAEGETELWSLKGMGELPDGTKVEIALDAKGDLHLLRPPERPAVPEASPTETTVSGERLPAEKKMGRGILNVLKGFMKQRVETSGPDPDAVPRLGRISVIDPEKGKVGEIVTLPDHLNDNTR